MPDDPLVVTDLPSTEPGEPSLSSGLYVGAATLVIDALVLFGAPINGDQKGYLISLLTFLGPIAAGFVIRAKVFSPKTVERITSALHLVIADRERTIAAQAAQLHTAASLAPLQATLPALVAKLPDPPGSTGVGSYPPPPQEPARSFLAPSPADSTNTAPQPVQEPYRPTQYPPLGQLNTATPEGFYDYAASLPVPPTATAPAGERRRHRLPE